MFPRGLIGKTLRQSFLCEEWELRVTGRCLEEDLGRSPASTFESLLGIEIVKEFTNARSDRTGDRKLISGLRTGVPVWILSRGHDHRGATVFDEEQHVVWLLAYGRHRSNSPDDFYKYCPRLDAADRLLPTEDDYERLFDDRGERFVDGLMVEAPLYLKEARDRQVEISVLIGGEMGAKLAIEVAGEAEATSIAVSLETLAGDHVPLVLRAFHAEGDWESASQMPSRPLEVDEVAFVHVHELDH